LKALDRKANTQKNPPRLSSRTKRLIRDNGYLLLLALPGVVFLIIFQYLPISYLLCRIYERTSSIWASIFLHMLINGVSIKALTMLEELL